MSLILAADVGGTNIRAAIVDGDGRIMGERRSRIELGDRSVGEKMLITRLVDFFAGLVADTPAVSAIGIGFPGFFLGNTGVLAASPNLPNLNNVPLADRLAEALNLPVHVQNDALCAAIGEHRFGAGKGATDLLHITLGTGIGGGLILGNRPWAGEGGMAMEFGHLRVVRGAEARPCGCGGRGCVEAHASATAIVARYAEASGHHTDAHTVHAKALSGDRTAGAIIETAGGYLGMALAEAIKLLDVRTVTISGGLTGAWKMLHPPMMDALNSDLIPPLKNRVRILPSILNDNAGLLGAAALADTGR